MRTTRRVSSILALCSLSIVCPTVQAQCIPSVKAKAINDCALKCGDDGQCIFGCLVGQDLSIDRCYSDCNGFSPRCLSSCLTVIQDIALSCGGVQVRYARSTAVDPVINVTNTNAAGGNLCANFYVHAPDEQQISCCSCLVTPNGLASLSLSKDLLSNTLTPAVPDSVVIKITSSVATNGATCNASAPGLIVPGLAAWGSSGHAGSSALTETPFSVVTSNLADQARITGICGMIQSNGSGFGICRSCRLGGQGAIKQ
jgi:hypothetical protein